MNSILSPSGRRYNASPLPPDHRDFGVARAALAAPVPIPSSVFLDEWLGPVRDQGAEGSCTAQSSAGDHDFQLRKYDPRFRSIPAPTLSAQFIYRMSRKMDGTADSDSGSDGRTTCKVLQQYGVCTETDWPYTAGDIFRDPSPEQLAAALNFRSGAYHFLYSVDDLKHCIASGYCFRLGFAVYNSFEDSTDKTTVYAPKSNESLLGYHEILGKGYDDSKFGGAFSIRNSWGAGWGVNGDFWMPYEVIADRRIFSDAVIQHLGRKW